MDKRKLLKLFVVGLLLKELVKAVHYHKETLIDPNSINEEKRDTHIRRALQIVSLYKVGKRLARRFR